MDTPEPNISDGDLVNDLILPFTIVVIGFITFVPEIHTKKLAWIGAIPFFLLALMFTLDYTSIELVAWYGGEELPLRYRFAATWAAREGPILLWAAWMALLATIWSKPFVKESKAAAKMRLRLMNGFTLSLLLISWSMKPFQQSNGYRGPGLNELLQTDLMVIHPPLIFLAYSFCIALACTAISSILTDTTGLKERLILIARPGFFFATLGIGLGGLWAYLILDWGGYWAWDPVETGSMLPWIALVVLLHLRTRPGKTTDTMWAGIAMLSAAMALFATMITRAGGVWAVSVHTFVVNSEGAAPTDVFGRLMTLRSDESGIEVICYLVGIIQLIAIILAWRLNGKFSKKWLLALPIIATLGIIGGGDVLDGFPPTLLVILALGPFVESGIYHLQEKQDKEWWYWMAIPAIMVALRIQHGKVLFELITLLLAFGLVFEKDRMKGWGWASAGVVVFLSAAWSGMIEIWLAAIGMVTFVSPWLLSSEDSDFKFNLKERSFQQKLALWTPVVVVGLYLVLTLMILISSIDAIQFAAHELYGAPFVAAIMLALCAWSMREKPQRVFWLLFVPVAIIPAAYFFGSELGSDSDHMIANSMSRGQVAMISLIPALLALPATMSLIKESIPRKGITMWAHTIHLGLVLLIIGHALSTTIVNRSTYEHSVTMVQDENIIWGDYEFKFIEVVSTTEGLEVGDGYLGAIIEVYRDGELIDTVEPGILRFDKENGPSTHRSEVDRISMIKGDLVFIMDGTQARTLMEGSDLVRITVYDLGGIHLVWAGWCLIMIGSIATWIRTPPLLKQKN